MGTGESFGQAEVDRPHPPSEDATVRTQAGSLPCMLPDSQALGESELPARYREVREFARGGMGRILLVHDTHLGRDVALKELLPACERTSSGLRLMSAAWEDGGSAAARFIQEACLTGQLEHPSIIPVYELGRHDDGVPYYTMRFVHGRSLKEAIEVAPDLQTRLGLLHHFLDACHAIAYAHSRGVIHRDVKPSNILIGEFGETAVIDWGIAKLRGDRVAPENRYAWPRVHTASSDGLTRTGENLGTPPYMSPEQARGNGGDIAEPADIYALGAVLYELLAGRPAYSGDSPEEVIARMLESEPLPVREIVPEIPPELAAICARAMQRDPALRYANARAIADDIQRFQTGTMVQAYQYTFQDRLRRFVWQYHVEFGALAMVSLLLLVMGAFSLTGILQEQSRTEYALYRSSISLAKALVDSKRYASALQTLEEAPAPHRDVEWGILSHRSHPELLTLRGHGDAVDYAAYRPDGTEIATCGRDGKLIVWNSVTGVLVRSIAAAPVPLHRVVWSPDGRYLSTSTVGEETVVWRAEDLVRVHTMAGYDPVFSSDGRLLANITHFGQQVTLWNVETGEIRETLYRRGHYLTHTDLSPDLRFVAASDVVGYIWIWDRVLGTCRVPENLHEPSARFVRFSPDGRWLATAGKDLHIRLWEVPTWRIVHDMTGHEDGIGTVTFTSDSRSLVSAANDRTVRVWDVGTGSVIYVLKGLANTEFAIPSPTDDAIIAGGEHNTAAVWPLPAQDTKDELLLHTAPVSDVSFSRDGRYLVSCAGRLGNRDDHGLLVWDVERRALHRRIECPDGFNYGICFWPDNSHIAAGGVGTSIYIFNLETGGLQSELRGHTGGIECLAPSPDMSLLASGGWDNRVILWNRQGQERCRLTGHQREIDALAFSPDGKRIATGSRDRTARIWDVATGNELTSLLADAKDGVKAVAFDGDGSLLATGGCDGSIRLWNVETGEQHRVIQGHEGTVETLVFTSDRRRIVSGSTDNSVRIWDVATGRQLLLLDKHTSRIRTVTFSPGEAYLATGSDDMRIILWPIDRWRPAGRSALSSR